MRGLRIISYVVVGVVTVGLLSAWQSSMHLDGSSIKEVKPLQAKHIDQLVVDGPLIAHVRVGKTEKPQLSIIRKTGDHLVVTQARDTLTVSYPQSSASKWGDNHLVYLDVSLPRIDRVSVSNRVHAHVDVDQQTVLAVSADNRSLVDINGALDTLVATVSHRSQVEVKPELQSLTVTAMDRSLLTAHVNNTLSIKALNRSIVNISGAVKQFHAVLKNRSLLNGSTLQIDQGSVDVKDRSRVTLASADNLTPDIENNSALSVLDK